MKSCLHQMLAVKLIALLALGSILSCKTKGGNNQSPSDYLDSNDPRNNGLALIQEKELITRPNVHAVRLDDIEFRVNALRVGEQTFLRHATPIVTYEMPSDADYVDILRCPSNVIIFGGAEDIDNVEIGAKDAASETKIFQRNNFWEAAVETSGCVLVASSYTDVSFEDSFAPSGTYHYYLRACVDQDRLIGTRSFSTSNCSRQVTRSAKHSHNNSRAKIEMNALHEAANLRNKIDTIGRQIVKKTILLNEQLYQCQQRHQARVLDFDRKNAIANIMTATVALGLPILGGAAIGLLKLRRNAELTFDGTQVRLRKSVRDYELQVKKFNQYLDNQAIRKKAGTSGSPSDIVSTQQFTQMKTNIDKMRNQITTRVDDHIKQLRGEIDRLEEALRKTKSSATKASIQEQLNNYNDHLTRLTALKASDLPTATADRAISLDGVDSIDTIRKAVDLNPHQFQGASRILAYTGVTAGSALILSSIYKAGAQAIPGFPKDAEYCYHRSSEEQLATQVGDKYFKKKEDLALLCSCAQALSTQTDLTTLATDLQQHIELYQAQLEISHIAREEAAASKEGNDAP